jgi:hypothetical protein
VLQPERNEAESGVFDALQDLAGVAGLQSIGLDDGKCALHKRSNYMRAVARVAQVARVVRVDGVAEAGEPG